MDGFSVASTQSSRSQGENTHCLNSWYTHIPCRSCLASLRAGTAGAGCTAQRENREGLSLVKNANAVRWNTPDFNLVSFRFIVSSLRDEYIRHTSSRTLGLYTSHSTLYYTTACTTLSAFHSYALLIVAYSYSTRILILYSNGLLAYQVPGIR